MDSLQEGFTLLTRDKISVIEHFWSENGGLDDPRLEAAYNVAKGEENESDETTHVMDNDQPQTVGQG